MKNDSPSRAHRLVWNDTAPCHHPPHETACGRSLSGRSAGVVRVACAGLSNAAGWAGPRVGAGSGRQHGVPSTIAQHSQGRAINENPIGAGSGDSVNDVQPGSNATALHHMTATVPSVTNGASNTKGQVGVPSRKDVLLGFSGRVKGGGLVASRRSLTEGGLNVHSTTLSNAAAGLSLKRLAPTLVHATRQFDGLEGKPDCA
jgi:hypothetical protein